MADPIRASFRRHVHVPCQVVRERDFKLVGDLAVDLSTEGMLVRARERILTGEEVILSLKLPRLGTWFDAQAVVARVLHGRRPGDPGLSFGLRFVGLSCADERRLFEALRGAPAPVALRPPRSLAA